MSASERATVFHTITDTIGEAVRVVIDKDGKAKILH